MRYKTVQILKGVIPILKKVSGILLAGTLIFSLTGCGTNSEPQKEELSNDTSKVDVRVIVEDCMEVISDGMDISKVDEFENNSKLEGSNLIKDGYVLTKSEQFAAEQAIMYLDYSPFSQKKLIEQLTYDGFSKEDAKIAIEAINVDWQEQTLRFAKLSTKYNTYPRNSTLLSSVLSKEGYTDKDIAYAIKRLNN